jgi:hypothetical protein
MRKLLVLAAVVAAAVGATARAAEAQTTTCSGVITGPQESVIVPKGAFCAIYSAQITGSVTALPGSSFDLEFSTVGRGVEADSPVDVAINADTVDGNVEVKGGGGPYSDVSICGSTLRDGNLEVTKFNGGVLIGGGLCPGFYGTGGNVLQDGSMAVMQNPIRSPGPFLDIRDNDVSHNVQVFGNSGTADKFVQSNTVGGTLECSSNDQPFTGGPNTASKTEGQCF